MLWCELLACTKVSSSTSLQRAKVRVEVAVGPLLRRGLPIGMRSCRRCRNPRASTSASGTSRPPRRRCRRCAHRARRDAGSPADRHGTAAARSRCGPSRCASWAAGLVFGGQQQDGRADVAGLRRAAAGYRAPAGSSRRRAAARRPRRASSAPRETSMLLTRACG